MDNPIKYFNFSGVKAFFLRRIYLWLSVPLGLLASLTTWAAIRLAWVYHLELLQAYPGLAQIFTAGQRPAVFGFLAAVLFAGSLFFVAVFVLGVGIRRPWVMGLLRKGFVAAYALFFVYAYTVISVTGRLEDFGLKKLGLVAQDSGEHPAVEIFYWRWEYLWPLCLAVLFLGLLHIISWRRTVMNSYLGEDSCEPAPGDRILENLRTHGKSPEYRKSLWRSILSHILVIIIIPWLLQAGGCVKRYRVPWGSGNPVVAMVRIVKPKKVEKRKKYILRPDSAIFFHIPDLDDSKIMEQVQDMTQLTYQADPNAAHGAMGTGGGNIPGWADGFKDGEMRFIRLQYEGAGWDDGMDAVSRADVNFLEKFRALSGGIKVAKQGESHPVRLLAKYPKGEAPPFVFMTGEAGIRISDNDIKILREYLTGGGMLFADCGSPSWDRSFRAFARRILPGNDLRVIAHDDPIFQMPFTFPNGAPPLWHHGGRQAMGIKLKNRWAVFYHPGDMNDAWKTGASGIDRDLAKSSYEMGVNIVYYAFTRYLEETRKARK